MLKNFRVTVNGSAYDVSVEELSQNASAPAMPQAAAAPAATAVAAPKPVAPAAAPAGGQSVTFPMPGVVVDVQTAVGQTVEKNQVVAILEAMKMENEIVTPYAGKVLSVNAAKGDSVNAGDLLITVG